MKNENAKKLECCLCKAPSGTKGITLMKVNDVYYCKGCYNFLLNGGYKQKEEVEENG